VTRSFRLGRAGPCGPFGPLAGHRPSKAVAHEAVRRQTGARGLRAILEETMLDLVYEIPSRRDIKEAVITEGVILKKEEPILVYQKEKAKENTA